MATAAALPGLRCVAKGEHDDVTLVTLHLLEVLDERSLVQGGRARRGPALVKARVTRAARVDGIEHCLFAA